MRFKSSQRLFFKNNTLCKIQKYGSMATQYSGMLNLASAYQRQMKSLVNSLYDCRNTLLNETLQNRLDYFWTYHSLKLTGHYSLSLEETIFLLEENRTHEGKNFFEQLKAINHRNAVEYCREYQLALPADGEQIDDSLLAGLRNIHRNFALILESGGGGSFDIRDGRYYPPGTCYFYDRIEAHDHLEKGCNLLIQCAREKPNDIFMTAAMIHGEFAKAHHFDKEDGLVFCRLYTNLALMMAGHAPIIIESSQKNEYLTAIKQQAAEQDPYPMAKFLVICLNKTYTKLVLPELEAGAMRAGVNVPIKFGHH